MITRAWVFNKNGRSNGVVASLMVDGLRFDHAISTDPATRNSQILRLRRIASNADVSLQFDHHTEHMLNESLGGYNDEDF